MFMYRSLSTVVFVVGLVVIINSSTWPFKALGAALLVIGFAMNDWVVEFFKKKK